MQGSSQVESCVHDANVVIDAALFESVTISSDCCLSNKADMFRFNGANVHQQIIQRHNVVVRHTHIKMTNLAVLHFDGMSIFGFNRQVNWARAKLRLNHNRLDSNTRLHIYNGSGQLRVKLVISQLQGGFVFLVDVVEGTKGFRWEQEETNLLLTRFIHESDWDKHVLGIDVVHCECVLERWSR